MRQFCLCLSLVFLLSACGSAPTGDTPKQDEVLSLVVTTYPLYLFASELTKNVDGVQVDCVVNQPISCLHDYTLNVRDMQSLENADVIVENGVNLEAFMDDALRASHADVIDCSEGIALLPLKEDPTVNDPHIWMDPDRAAAMIQTLSNGLSRLDPTHSEQYAANCTQAVETLRNAKQSLKAELASLSCRELITFHDGFSYFADSFDLTILKAIEEEAGSEPSAKEISAIADLIQLNKIPAIFTEVNGSDATAKALAKETSVSIHTLSMIMSGDSKDPGLSIYLSALEANVSAIKEAL
ncbi:MAG: metal ABC transporter substrate-binding protein [Evtepia sp.]